MRNRPARAFLLGPAAPRLHWITQDRVNPQVGHHCYAGFRICPDNDCKSLIFVIAERGEVIAS